MNPQFNIANIIRYTLLLALHLSLSLINPPSSFASDCTADNIPPWFHRYVCLPIPPSDIPSGHAIQDGCTPKYPQSTWKGQYAEMEFVATRPAMINACNNGQLKLKTLCVPTQQEVDYIMVFCDRRSAFYQKWWHSLNEGGSANNPIIVTDETSVRNAVNYRSMVLADKKEWKQGEFTFKNVWGWTTYVNNTRTIPLPPVDTSIKYPQLPGPVPLEVRANPVAQRIIIHPDSWHPKACWYFTRGLFTQDTLIWIDLPECLDVEDDGEDEDNGDDGGGNGDNGDGDDDDNDGNGDGDGCSCECNTLIPKLDEILSAISGIPAAISTTEDSILRRSRGEHFTLLQAILNTQSVCRED